jgi:hypothetical protein
MKRSLLLLPLMLLATLTACSKEENCIHAHTASGAVITYCGKEVKCSSSRSDKSFSQICHVKNEVEQ